MTDAYSATLPAELARGTDTDDRQERGEGEA